MYKNVITLVVRVDVIKNKILKCNIDVKLQ